MRQKREWVKENRLAVDHNLWNSIFYEIHHILQHRRAIFLPFERPNPDLWISKFVPPFIHFLSFWSWIFWEFNWICFHILLLRIISITNGTLFIWRSFSAIFSCMHSHHHRKSIHMFSLNETNEQNSPILLCFDFIFIFWIFQIFCLFFLSHNVQNFPPPTHISNPDPLPGENQIYPPLENSTMHIAHEWFWLAKNLSESHDGICWFMCTKTHGKISFNNHNHNHPFNEHNELNKLNDLSVINERENWNRIQTFELLGRLLSIFKSFNFIDYYFRFSSRYYFRLDMCKN